MRIYCTMCRNKAQIFEADEVSPDLMRLYCQCRNAKDCGHRFVMNLLFSHTLVLPTKSLEDMSVDYSTRTRKRRESLRVSCPKCQSKAGISSRDQVSLEFAKLYCRCKSATGCGHRFVMILAFARTLVSTGEPIDRMLFDRLHMLPLKQQRELFEQLGISSA